MPFCSHASHLCINVITGNTTQFLKINSYLSDNKISGQERGIPPEFAVYIALGASNQVMMSPSFSLVMVALKIPRKARNGNYHSCLPLTAQLPEFKGTSLMVKKEKQN